MIGLYIISTGCMYYLNLQFILVLIKSLDAWTDDEIPGRLTSMKVEHINSLHYRI